MRRVGGGVLPEPSREFLVVPGANAVSQLFRSEGRVGVVDGGEKVFEADGERGAVLLEGVTEVVDCLLAAGLEAFAKGYGGGSGGGNVGEVGGGVGLVAGAMPEAVECVALDVEVANGACCAPKLLEEAVEFAGGGGVVGQTGEEAEKGELGFDAACGCAKGMDGLAGGFGASHGERGFELGGLGAEILDGVKKEGWGCRCHEA